MEIYLALGSNLGDRRRNILDALGMLDRLLGTVHDRLSSILESESWGFEAPPFLDAVAVYRIPDPGDPYAFAESLLGMCKEVERAMGRKDGPLFDEGGKRVYHDRTIDVDILFLGRYIVDTPQLSIPHPLISERDFILAPLKEVLSDEIRSAFGTIFRE